MGIIKMILRERRERARSRKWRSTRKFQEERREKRRLEEKLGRLRERVKPDELYNIEGVYVGVHKLRDRYRGEPRFRFEFSLKHSKDWAPDNDFSRQDLDTLEKAVQFAKHYSNHFASKNGSQPRPRPRA